MVGFSFGFRNLTYFYGHDSIVSKYFWSVKDSCDLITIKLLLPPGTKYDGRLFYRPHSEGMGKVLFSQVSVCSHFFGGYPHLADGGGGGEGTPIPGQDGEYPHTRSGLGGVPHPRSGQRVPHPRSGRGGGTPSRSGPRSGHGGYPPTGTAQHGLATRWVVCRRTFLYFLFVWLFIPWGGVTPFPSHNTSTGPMSFLWGYPSDWSRVPSQGGTAVTGPRSPFLGVPQNRGTPQLGMGYPLARTRVPPSPDTTRLDRLRRGQYDWFSSDTNCSQHRNSVFVRSRSDRICTFRVAFNATSFHLYLFNTRHFYYL